MAVPAFNFFRQARKTAAPQPELVAADAAALRGLSREIPRKWQMLDALTAELGRVVGMPTVVKRPEQQFFPIAAELAGGDIREAVSAELTDLIALLEPAVEHFVRAGTLDAEQRGFAFDLLDEVTASRIRMVAMVPPAAE